METTEQLINEAVDKIFAALRSEGHFRLINGTREKEVIKKQLEECVLDLKNDNQKQSELLHECWLKFQHLRPTVAGLGPLSHTLKQYKHFPSYKDGYLNMKKALEKIQNYPEDDSGRAGCRWGDTDYDSLSVQYGYNSALENVREIAQESLK
jgi:hypothetical protein